MKKRQQCRTGLKGNGALKKGFRFLKGGKIVRAGATTKKRKIARTKRKIHISYNKSTRH